MSASNKTEPPSQNSKTNVIVHVTMLVVIMLCNTLQLPGELLRVLIPSLYSIFIKPEFLQLKARCEYLRCLPDSIVPQSLETTSLCKPSHNPTQGVGCNKASEVEK